MKVNAKNVSTLAKRKEDENYDLRRYLKEQDELSEEEVDRLVSDITRRVWASFDCTTCANCCKQLGRSVTEQEFQCLATALALSGEEFRSRYLAGKIGPDEDDEMRGTMREVFDGGCAVSRARSSRTTGVPSTRSGLGSAASTPTCTNPTSPSALSA